MGKTGGLDKNKRTEIDLSHVTPELFFKLKKAAPVGEDINGPGVEGGREGWIIRCPKTLDIKSLLTEKIYLDGSTSVHSVNEEGNEMFEVVALHQNKQQALLMQPEDASFRIDSFQVNGLISIRRHIADLEPPEIFIPKKKKRKLPRGIKIRHPIYGVTPPVVTTKSRKRKRSSP